ncbi:MAG: hypothetical protein JNN00_10010 [Chitinophagaceae bacterium]|nr:hypothetical protein [Chitinophagaceae bacterium]
MENNFSKEATSKFNAIGTYQIAGGIIGLGLTIWIISGLITITGPLLLLLLIAIGLYSYSIYCGILLLKKKKSGLGHSLINQFLQLINFSLLGFVFQYISGVFLSIGFDLTNSLNFTFNIGISSWQITINGDTEPFIFNFNFVALFLILWIENLRRKINKEQIEKQITSIGE